MAFIPVISGPGPQVRGLRCRLHVTKNPNGRRRLAFNLSRDLIEKLGWQAGDRMVVALGVDTHIGAFQISRVTRPRAGIRLLANPGCHGGRVHITLPDVIHGVRAAELLDAFDEPVNLDVTLREGVVDARLPVRQAKIDGSANVVALTGAAS